MTAEILKAAKLATAGSAGVASDLDACPNPKRPERYTSAPDPRTKTMKPDGNFYTHDEMRRMVADHRAKMRDERKRPANPQTEIARLRAENTKLARWIIQHCDHWHGDHACAECFPDARPPSDAPVIPGFRCAVHVAREIA